MHLMRICVLVASCLILVEPSGVTAAPLLPSSPAAEAADIVQIQYRYVTGARRINSIARNSVQIGRNITTYHPTAHPNYGVRHGYNTYTGYIVRGGRLSPSTRTYYDSTGHRTTRQPITQYIIRR